METAKSELIDIGDARLEVTRGGASSGPVVIAAAHPADALEAGSAALLNDASGVGIVCVNPRGVGGSSPAQGEPPALEEMVDDVEAVRRRLGLGPWVFWGMSGGGWLGQIYARKYPEALRGVILESVCPCFRARLADPACLLSPFHPSWRAALDAQGLIALDSHATVGDARETEWIEIAGVGSVFRRKGGPALLVSPMPLSPRMRAVMPALWSHDARAWLPSLRLPALILCGTADPVVPLAHARALHGGLASSHFVAIEGAGHVPVSQQHPEVAVAVRRFLEGGLLRP
jgi:3-oxoadipate enol-lactonase